MLGKIGPRIIVPSSTTVNSCCQPRSCLVNGSDAWQRRGRAHSSREADKREVPSTSCEDWRRKKCTIDSAPGLALVTNGVKYYAISVKTTVFPRDAELTFNLSAKLFPWPESVGTLARSCHSQLPGQASDSALSSTWGRAVRASVPRLFKSGAFRFSGLIRDLISAQTRALGAKKTMAKAMVDNLNPVPLYARILSPNSFSNFRSFGAITNWQ